MKKVILISLVALMTQACGSAPTPIDHTLPSSALVSTVLACEIATTLPTSTDPVIITYDLQTFEDGHAQINCSTHFNDLVLNLTCLETSPYNYSFQYLDTQGNKQTMNVTVSPINTIQAHVIDSTEFGLTSSQACKTITYPN